MTADRAKARTGTRPLSRDSGRGACDAYSLHGKVVLVTGAAHEYGRACAQRFASAGAAVVATDARNVADSVTKLKVPFVRADAADGDQLHGVYDRVLDLHGRIDGVVCVAGTETAACERSLSDLDEEAFAAELRANAHSLFWTLKLATAHVADGGAIVGLTGASALWGGATISAPAAAGAAALALARSAALELAPRRVRVNMLVAGPFDTPYLGDSERELQIAAHLNPLGRMPRPDEFAGVAQFLLADESSFITGATIPFDGGASAGPLALNVVGAMQTAIGPEES